jgi:surface protein
MDFSNAIDNNGTAAVFQCCIKMKKAPNIKFPSNNTFSLANFFWGCENLEEVPLYNTHMCNNMSSMFSGKSESGKLVGKMKLKKVPLFDTSNVTNFSNLFGGCYLLESIPLFDTGNATNMKNMLCFCNKIKNVPLFDTKNVTNIVGFCMCCCSLTSVPKFNTSKVTDMHNMFSGKAYTTTVFEDVDMHISEVPNFDYSKVTKFDDFFSNNIDITEIPDMNIEANVTKCNNMFINCKNVQTGAKALYDKLSVKSSITNHTDAFKNCGSNTETGRAELAQIPTSWGGELS